VFFVLLLRAAGEKNKRQVGDPRRRAVLRR